MPLCGAETHLFFSHLAIDASDTSASRTWAPCRPASPIAPSEASYEGRNELEECLDNDGRSVASTVCVTKRHKTSRFGFFASHLRDRVHLKKKYHLESGLNQRDRATGGFVGLYTHRKPGKIFDGRGFH